MKPFKHIRTLTLLLVGLYLVIVPRQDAASASIPKKPVKFGVESISRLRSRDILPERAEPVVYEDLIFVASSRKKLVAFDFQGKKKLESRIEFRPVSTPAISYGRIYVGGDDGKFHCLEIATGRQIWDLDLKSLDFSRPAVTEQMVIFQTGSDRVVALDAISGDWKWEYQHLRGDDLAVRGLCPPLVRDNVVYVGLSGGSVVALDEITGRLIWKTRAAIGEQFMDVDAPLGLDETSVYAVSVGGEVSALSRRTGRVFWNYSAGGMAGMTLSEDMIFIGTDDARLMAIDKITGRPVWTTDLVDKQNIKFYHLPTRPLLIDDYVITVSRGGKIMALDQGSGTMAWDIKLHSDTTSPLVSVAGIGFLAMDNKGVIRLWRTSSR